MEFKKHHVRPSVNKLLGDPIGFKEYHEGLTKVNDGYDAICDLLKGCVSDSREKNDQYAVLVMRDLALLGWIMRRHKQIEGMLGDLPEDLTSLALLFDDCLDDYIKERPEEK